MRIIPVSRRDIQYGINDCQLVGVYRLPFDAKLHVYHLEVDENSFETKVIALVGAVIVKGKSFMYDSRFCDKAFPIKIYLEVDDKTIQRAVNVDDVTDILGNILHVVPVRMVVGQEIDRHEKTNLETKNKFRS